MNRRCFGRTGIEISELTLGAGFVGGLLIHASDDDKRGASPRASKRQLTGSTPLTAVLPRHHRDIGHNLARTAIVR